MEQTSGSTSLCLNSNWLDRSTDPAVGSTRSCYHVTTDSTQHWTAPYDSWNTYWHGSYPDWQKITLKLSEVMYLREKAADDKKLRKILNRFAPHIEITVDFPGGAK